MLTIDHLMWAAPDLDAARRDFADRLGLDSVPGGSHPGNGTRNALVGLGEGCYLEIIAPDPAQPLRGTLGEQIASRAAHLRTWAVRVNDLPSAVHELAGLGLAVTEPHPMSRGELRWHVAFVRGMPEGFPFLIDWGTMPHPAGRLPAQARLVRLTVPAPAHTALAPLVLPACLECGVALTAELSTPDRGTLVL